MRYDTWYDRPRHDRPRRRVRGRRARPDRPVRERTVRERAAPIPMEWLPQPDRRHPFPLEGPGYTGRGEAGRYGSAPVPYGPDHTYDYHMGDRYGYGPDFVQGEERVRSRRLPGLGRGPRRRRPERR